MFRMHINEYDREFAAACVRPDVPDLMPWVSASLSIAAVHVHVGDDGNWTELPKTRGGDPGDALTSLVFPLAYKQVSSEVQAAVAMLDTDARTYTYQDDMEAVCTTGAVAAARDAYETGCKRAGLRPNVGKMKATLGRGADHNALPNGISIDPKATVLRHVQGGLISVMPSQQHAEGSQLCEGSEEVRAVIEKRATFYQRLRKLRAAGLKPHIAMALLRARTAGDVTFLACACGIPMREARGLDAQLLIEIDCVLGQGGAIAGGSVARRLAFSSGYDGGMGFQSIERSSPAAYTASWHLCMPRILTRIGLASVSALITVSPWAATCLPAATEVLRAALGDHSVQIGEEGIEASQHTLAIAPNVAASSSVSHEISGDLKASAVLRSAGGKGASVWMNAPTLPNQHLSLAQFAIAMLTRLHLPLPHCVGQCQHRRRDGTLCGADLDRLGIHARMCSVGGWLIRRHDAACAVLAAWCEDMGCQIEAGLRPWGEVLVPWAAPARPEARMDLVVHAPGIAGPLYIDLTIVNALSQEALAGGSAVCDGVAGEIAARGKFKDYPNCRVIPFAIEDHGRLSEHALQLIRMLAPADPADRSVAIRRLHQSLGATIQRSTADAVLAATAARRPA